MNSLVQNGSFIEGEDLASSRRFDFRLFRLFKSFHRHDSMQISSFDEPCDVKSCELGHTIRLEDQTMYRKIYQRHSSHRKSQKMLRRPKSWFRRGGRWITEISWRCRRRDLSYWQFCVGQDGCRIYHLWV